MNERRTRAKELLETARRCFCLPMTNQLSGEIEHVFHDTWQHFKGGVYKIHGFALDTSDGTPRVLYHRIGGPEFDHRLPEKDITFARPLTEWFDALPEGEVLTSESQTTRFVPVVSAQRWAVVPVDTP